MSSFYRDKIGALLSLTILSRATEVADRGRLSEWTADCAAGAR